MQISKDPARRINNTIFTPLGIIAAFVTLSETIAGFAAIRTDGTVQLIFAIFAVAFPAAVAGIFFAVLWYRSYVFYPPQEFGAEVDVGKYVSAMKHQPMGTTEMLALVQSTLADTLGSDEAQASISKIVSDGAPSSEAAAEIAAQAVERIEHAVLTIDISEFESGTVPDLAFRYNGKQDAFELLSAVYFQIDSHVPPFAYGKSWVLKDSDSGKLILPSGVDWEDNYALAESGTSVAQLGLRPGMRLQAIPMQKARAQTTRRKRKGVSAQ